VKFGAVPLDEALDAVAVHSVRLPGIELRKGTLLNPAVIERLREAGITDIVVARPEPGDIDENEAAATVAAAISGTNVVPDDAFTGRANIRAAVAGVLVVDRAAVDALNAVDEAVTLATLPDYRPVRAGEMIGTVKIIPFAIPASTMQAVEAMMTPMLRVANYRLKTASVISTLLPGLPEKIIAKTLRVTASRLASAGVAITDEQRVSHSTHGVADGLRHAVATGAEIALVFGASAIADRRDVIPAGIEAAGGVVEHFGMPVDPGNLLLLGRIGAMPVIGAPGCARSPRENGFDWILRRLLAGLAVSRSDVTSLGVGGLLMEIPTRPQPRESAALSSPGRAAVVVLAAGRGTRMPHANKLAATLHGEPLVRLAVQSALVASSSPVIVVTGHEPEKVKAALEGLDVTFVHNPDYGEGLSTSLKAGIAALPEDVGAAVVVLGDMPRVSPALIDMLAGALKAGSGQLIAVPVREGRRGNPVAWARQLFPALMALSGDVGARHLIADYAEAVVEVPVEDDGAFTDIDTRDELEMLELHEIAMRSNIDASIALDGMESEDA